MGMFTRSPIVPPAWTVAGWWIDPANVSGVASDGNSGTAATGARCGAHACAQASAGRATA